MGDNFQEGSKKQYQKEISIKELILKLWNGKLIIAIVTIACLVLGSLYTFILADSQYISKATIKVKNDEDLGLNTSSYIKIVKDADLLNKTIDSLGLDNVSTGSLNDMLKVKELSDELIEISVVNTDPQAAMSIANAHSENFKQFISNQVQNTGTEDVEYFSEQLEIAEKNLLEKKEALTKFLNEHDDLDVLQSEIESLTIQASSYLVDLNNAENDVNLSRLLLLELYKMADEANIDVSDNINVGLSVSYETASDSGNPDSSVPDETTSDSDNFESSLSDETAFDSGDFIIIDPTTNAVEDTMLAIKIANTETDLITASFKKEVFTETINDIKKQLQEKKLEYISLEYDFTRLNNEYLADMESCNLYQTNLLKAEDIAASYFGVTNIEIISRAVAADKPSSPDVVQNIIISLIVGLVLGVAIVLFRSFIKSNSIKKEKQ